MLLFYLFICVHGITKQPTTAPTFPPTSAPTSAPTPKPDYCNGPATLNGTSGIINYMVGSYESKNCSWSITARPKEVVYLNFSRLEVSVDSSYCKDCVGACLKSAQGFLYSCSDLRSYCASNSIVKSVCPQTCQLCDNCQYSYLRVRSGGAELSRACGLDTPMPLLVTSPEQNVTVDIVWGYMLAGGYTPISRTDGFTLSWRSAPSPQAFNGTRKCGRVKNLQGTSGGLISDGSEGTYAPNSNCLWVIAAPTGSFVNLQFTQFELKVGTSMGANGFTSCLTDYVRVYDGNFTTGNAPILGTFCGTRMPRNLTSSQQFLSVQFVSDDVPVSTVGFEAQYSFTSQPGPSPNYCSGTVNVTSPGTIVQSGDYPPSLCRWVIAAPPGQFVQLDFVELSVEPSFPACEYDYVEVLDSGLMLMRLCDNISPPTLTSFSNQATIVFFADDYLAGSGMTVVVSFVNTPGVKPSMCVNGTTLITAGANDTGIIEDGPVYGRTNEINTNCSWLIVSPPGTTVKLIYRRLELDPNCTGDSIIVYDGTNATAAQLQQVCGTRLPDPVTSRSNSLFVAYGANGVVFGSGFSIRYTIVNAPDNLHTDRQCDGVTELNSSSPRNFSDSSDGSSPRVSCVWRIIAPPSQFISLNITSIDLGLGDDGCLFEYLTVHDGDSHAFPLIDTCGQSLPASVVSSSNVLSILYFNDFSKRSPGFTASWDLVDKPGSNSGRVCGGTIYPASQLLPRNGETSGVISQTGDMTDYRHGIYCGWVIQAPQGQFVRLRFTNFSSPNPTGICRSYLAVLDGPSAHDYELQKSCGNELPLAVVSTQSTLHVQALDFGPASLYFEAQWDFVTVTPGRPCNGSVEYREPNGTIASGGQSYASNANCSFQLTAPVGQVIRLTVASFSLQLPVNGSCKDLVRIESGSDVLYEGCTLASNTTFFTNVNSARVSFTSDNSIAAAGFVINYLFMFPLSPAPSAMPTTRSPSSAAPTSPTAREITFAPSTGSPTSQPQSPTAALVQKEAEQEDVAGTIIATLIALMLVCVFGGILGHLFYKKRKARTAQVQPTTDEAAGQEITVL